MTTVLVVDDDDGIRESAAMALEKVGHRTLQASDVASALKLLKQHRVDVVVSDIYMPGDNGLALLEAIAQRPDPPRVILMTARGTIETTALAHRGGAFDYLAKPFELSELIARVRAALSVEEEGKSAESVDSGPESRMVGSHRSMVEMYKAISRVASLAMPVLILGESGTGKELVAHSIHDLGGHAEGPFIAINCGAIPDTLLENELFGSVRGAYTDARQDRRGALSRADGGSLFLDEIGDISPAFQVKLLRFLQDGLVTPLGSDKSHHVSVRMIAATHRDLKNLVAGGRFREDLYYRLAGYEITVPPLRERASDLPLLIEHFRRSVAVELGRENIPGPAAGVLELFSGHAWRGNVRELEQVIRRTVIDSGALLDVAVAERAMREVSPHHDSAVAAVDEEALQSADSDPLVALDEAERRHITAVLRATRGNQTKAAFILGIERKTLSRKIKRLAISVEESSEP